MDKTGTPRVGAASRLRVLHVDMDAFFASVEQRDDPSLRGRPVIVGGPSRRGVVSSASYEARKFGIHNAMPTAHALRLCPQAVVVGSGFGKYREASRRVHDVFRRFTPVVESVGADEAYLDVAGVERLLGPAEWVATEVKAAVRREVDLPCSVGVAPNKLLAKMGSGLAKPDGLLVLSADRAEALLPGLPVGRLRGVGPALTKRLGAMGVRTVGDLQALSLGALERRFGKWGGSLWRRARGLDARRVTPARAAAKSLGKERTFFANLVDRGAMRRVVRDLAGGVGRALRAKGYSARVVRLKVRFGDFETITRERTLERRTDGTSAIAAEAEALLAGVRMRRGVRLLGVTAGGLTRGGVVQRGLFTDDEAVAALDRALDRVASRHGEAALQRGLGAEALRRRSGVLSRARA